jgi:hypothetical protein
MAVFDEVDREVGRDSRHPLDEVLAGQEFVCDSVAPVRLPEL